MNQIEIERKFEVIGEFLHLAVKNQRIRQGYLCRNEKSTSRIRIKGDEAFITIKGKSTDNGLSRFEFEQKIEVNDAEKLLLLCNNIIIEKIRYYIPYGKHIIEVDKFLGENEGLIFAEVEFSEINETFEKPDFLGNELTGDNRFYNSYLSIFPYSKW